MIPVIKDLFGDSSTQSLSLVDDVVKQKHIERIDITCYKNWNNDFIFYGIVSFKSNGTSLQQRFEGCSLAQVFVKIQKFCINLP